MRPPGGPNRDLESRGSSAVQGNNLKADEAQGVARVLESNLIKAARMLYDGRSVQDTAAALGVNRVTIWRWRREKPFKKEWRRLERNARRRLARWEARQWRLYEKGKNDHWETMHLKLEQIAGKSGFDYYEYLFDDKLRERFMRKALKAMQQDPR